MALQRARFLAHEVLAACTEAGGQWVTTDALYKRYGSDPNFYGHGKAMVDGAIELLADEGRIQIDPRSKRRLRLTPGPVEPASEPEGPTRIQMIADLIRRAQLTEAEAEEIRALLPPARVSLRTPAGLVEPFPGRGSWRPWERLALASVTITSPSLTASVASCPGSQASSCPPRQEVSLQNRCRDLKCRTCHKGITVTARRQTAPVLVASYRERGGSGTEPRAWSPFSRACRFVASLVVRGGDNLIRIGRKVIIAGVTALVLTAGASAATAAVMSGGPVDSSGVIPAARRAAATPRPA